MFLVKKFFVFWLETSFRAKPLEKIVTCFDMSEAGLSNLVSIGQLVSGAVSPTLVMSRS